MKQRVQVLTVAVVAVLFAVVFGASASLHAGQAAKIDITGAWLFSVDTGTIGTPTVTFKQDGEKLTGHYSSSTLGEADFTGTLKGQDLAFSFNADAGGTPVDVVYKGTVASNTDMKGTIDVAGGAVSGTFTGKRK
jgi:hypothetical protein